MTPWLIKLLLVEYLIIAVVAFVEAYRGDAKAGPWCLYYVAAALISVAVLWM
ncbi:hypothetical protein LCGC14_1435660, partial [marine sediment metagenome]